MHGNPNIAERDKNIKQNMSKIKNKIIVMSGKGGVGKSTTSVNLAAYLAKKGYKVGLLDADLHGPNVPFMFGVEGEKLGSLNTPYKVNDNLSITSISFFLPSSEDPIVWRGPQKMGAIMEMLESVEWGDIDYLVVDLPPGTGDETLTIAQQLGDNKKGIVVTTPQGVSLLDSTKAVKFSKLLGIELLGIIENMSGFICPDCGKEMNIFKKDGGKLMAESSKVDFLGSIPIDENVVNAGEEGRPFVYNEESISTEKFSIIADKIISKL